METAMNYLLYGVLVSAIAGALLAVCHLLGVTDMIRMLIAGRRRERK